jgi:hypothetical protein
MKVTLYAAWLLLFSESAAALFVRLDLPKPALTVLYPPLRVLEGYCSAHSCLYDSTAVASLYVVQLLTLVLFALLIAPVAISSRPPVERTAASIFGLLIFGTLVDYAYADFSFSPKWIFPNNVTESPFGLFRYAIEFSLAAVAMAGLALGGRKPDALRARRPA